MRVLLLHKALVNGAYQKKAEALAAIPGVELTVVVQPSWKEARWGTVPLERRHTAGYELVVAPIWFNGHHHVHCYPTLGRIVRRARPDVCHVDEEPFNLATAEAFYWAGRVGAPALFVTWARTAELTLEAYREALDMAAERGKGRAARRTAGRA